MSLKTVTWFNPDNVKQDMKFIYGRDKKKKTQKNRKGFRAFFATRGLVTQDQKQ